MYALLGKTLPQLLLTKSNFKVCVMCNNSPVAAETTCGCQLCSDCITKLINTATENKKVLNKFEKSMLKLLHSL